MGCADVRGGGKGGRVFLRAGGVERDGRAVDGDGVRGGVCVCGREAARGRVPRPLPAGFTTLFFTSGQQPPFDHRAPRGLCPQRGVLTDADGRRWRVAYSGDAWLAADMPPVTCEEEVLDRYIVCARHLATCALSLFAHCFFPLLDHI